MKNCVFCDREGTRRVWNDLIRGSMWVCDDCYEDIRDNMFISDEEPNEESEE